MARQTVRLPFIAWRDGRPRFVPGVRERVLGFKGQDLRHDSGAWFTFEEARAWSQARHAEITAARGGGRRKKKLAVPRGKTVFDLLEDFLSSADFKRPRAAGGYSDKTRRDYEGKARALRYQPGSTELEPLARAPAALLEPPEVRAFYSYLERTRGQTMARGAIMVLSAAYSWARTEPSWRLAVNPCHRLDLPKPAPRLRIATDAEIRALLAAADRLGLASVGDAIMLGLFTGQRQGDVLELVAADRGAGRIRFQQSKTGARVSIPEAPMLAARLARGAGDRPGVTDTTVVICEATGRRYKADHFRHCYARVRAAALAECPSLASFNYQDLRDTAVTWYARAGSTLPEIASITGHSLKSIHTIMAHYLSLDEHLADNAMRKLESWLDEQGMTV